MDDEIDLIADLNAADDDSLGSSTLADAPDPSGSSPGPCFSPETASGRP